MRPWLRVAARGDAVMRPVGLLGDPFLQAFESGFLLGEERLGPGLERGEALLEHAQLAAVEPPDPAAQRGEEGAVVADDDERAAEAGEVLLEALDGRQVEVVGRLVEQQHVGLADQRAGERRAARLAAGERGDAARRVDPQALEQALGAVAAELGVLARRQAGLRRRKRGRVGREVRLLRQVGDGRARLQEALAGVELDQPGERLEQRRLARAVAADEADPLALGERQREPGEQRLVADPDGGRA